MKKLFIYILILLSFKSFAQKDSIEIKGKMVAIEDRLPVWKKEYDIPKSYNLISAKFVLPNREVSRTPLAQVSLEENLLSIDQNKVTIDFYREFLGKEFKLNLKDTLTLSEEDIVYIKGKEASYSDASYYATLDKKYFYNFYELIALNKANKDTLNGLCKVKASQANRYHYDYYIGYFYQGSPYIENTSNVFEFYKADTLAKRRFIIRKRNSSIIFTEDYIPLGNKQWQREVRPFLSPHPTIKDTVVYTNKARKRQYFVVTTNKSSEGYKGRYSYRVPNSTQHIDSISTFEIEMLYLGKHKEATQYFYKIRRTQKLKILPNDNRVKIGAETRYLDRGLYHEKHPQYYTKRLRGSMSHFEEGVPRASGSYHYYLIFVDTLDYIQNAYVQGQQEFYNVSRRLDKVFLDHTKIYQKGKLKSMIYSESCQPDASGSNWIDCTVEDVSPLYNIENYIEPSLSGTLLIRFGNKAAKNAKLKYYKEENNQLRYYCKYKNIRYSLQNKYIKEDVRLYAFDIRRRLKVDYDNNVEVYMMPTISYDYYNKEYTRKTKYRPKRIRVMDNIQSKQDTDSLNIKYYEQFIPNIREKGTVEINDPFSLIDSHKKGVYIIKINNVIRYRLRQKIKGNPKKLEGYASGTIIKHFDRNGKLISKKEYNSEYDEFTD